MAARFLIGEDNNVEYGVPREYLAQFNDVYEDENYSRLLSELIYSLPFIISTNKEFKIPSGQQLINIDGIEVNGQLTIEGSLVI